MGCVILLRNYNRLPVRFYKVKKNKKKFYIEEIFHCPENPTPFDKLMLKWYPVWTRIDGYVKLEGAKKGLHSILKKKYIYDNDCSYRIVDLSNKVQL